MKWTLKVVMNYDRWSFVFCSSSSHVCSLPHGVDTSFSRLLRYILSACSSLDLCLFSFSNMDLSRAVLLLHSRGVTIRVLTDKVYSAISGSQIGVLRKAGKGGDFFLIYIYMKCFGSIHIYCNLSQCVTQGAIVAKCLINLTQATETYCM